MEECKRCGRTDLNILSNGYCTRCDKVKFGYHEYMPMSFPIRHKRIRLHPYSKWKPG